MFAVERGDAFRKDFARSKRANVIFQQKEDEEYMNLYLESGLDRQAKDEEKQRETVEGRARHLLPLLLLLPLAP